MTDSILVEHNGLPCKPSYFVPPERKGLARKAKKQPKKRPRGYQIFNPGYLHVGIKLLGAIGGTALSSTLPRVAPLG